MNNALKIFIVLMIFVGMMFLQAFSVEDLNNICEINGSILYNNGTSWSCVLLSDIVQVNNSGSASQTPWTSNINTAGYFLMDNAGTPLNSIDASSRILYANDGTSPVLYWNVQRNGGSERGIKFPYLFDTDNLNLVLDPQARSLYSDNGMYATIDFANGLLKENSADRTSIDWDSRLLKAIDGTTTILDYSSIADFGTAMTFKLGYDASNYMTATVDSVGSVDYDLTGTSPIHRFSQTIKGEGGFKSSDGTDGITDANTGTVTDVQSKDGLVTSVTRVTPVADGTYTYDDGVNTQISFTTSYGIVTAASVSTVLDSRLMTNINYVNNINTSKYLTPVTFKWSSDGLKQYPSTTVSGKTGIQTGYLAQDVQKFYPSCMLSEVKNLTGKAITYLNFNRNCVNYYLGVDLINKNVEYETKLNNMDKRLKEVEIKIK